MYTYMPASKLKLGPLKVPGLGTRIEANSIQLPYDWGVVMTSDHHNPEENVILVLENLKKKYNILLLDLGDPKS